MDETVKNNSVRGMVFLLFLFGEESWFIEKVCHVTQAGLGLTTSLVMTLYPGSSCLYLPFTYACKTISSTSI